MNPDNLAGGEEGWTRRLSSSFGSWISGGKSFRRKKRRRRLRSLPAAGVLLNACQGLSAAAAAGGDADEAVVAAAVDAVGLDELLDEVLYNMDFQSKVSFYI